MLASHRWPKRLPVTFLAAGFLFILQNLIPRNHKMDLQQFDILHEGQLHVRKSLSKYQAQYYEVDEENFIKGIKISIPVSCSTSDFNETIFRVSSSSLDVTVEENILYANICIISFDEKCPLELKFADEFCTSVSLGIGVTHYYYPLCRKLKPRAFEITQNSLSRRADLNCNVLVRLKRHLSRKVIADTQLLTCAFFQTCAFIINERLPCGIHNFSSSIPWSETVRLLRNQKHPDIKSLAGLYKGRIYPLWLLPCVKKCTAHSQCFWNDAQLLRFSLKINRDPENIEMSRQSDSGALEDNLEKSFTSSLPESAWIEMRQYMLNNSILFVGDSTLRGQMYALLRKLNGSLHFWEASHGLIAFTSLHKGNFFHKPIGELNQNNTRGMIAFAYFPVFWRQRDSKLNLISFIDQSVRREVRVRKVIIKSRQAGFHVPNYVTHHFGLNDHIRTERQTDKKIWKLGGQLNWHRMDDYHLTWSQLNHFIADFQCSCHFHKIYLSQRAGEYEIKGEIAEALLQNLVYLLLNGT